GSLEITAEGQVQIHAFAEAGSADLGELDFCGEVFPGKAQDCKNVDLTLFELLPAKLHRIGTARNRIAQRTFAFTEIIIAGKSVFYVFKRAQSRTHIACCSGFLLGGTEILRSLKFTAKENRLRDSSGETPDHGIEQDRKSTRLNSSHVS